MEYSGVDDDTATVGLRRGRRARLRRTGVVLVALAMLSAGAPVAGADFPVPDPPGPAPGDAPQRYRDQVFESVNATLDIEYGQSESHTGEIEPRFADVYTPAGDTVERRPLMIWMHGGGFSSGNRGSMASFAADSARRGWVGATISYRIRPGFDVYAPSNWREALAAIRDAGRDAQMAVRYFRTNAEAYGIDPDIIVVGGYSAGAVASLWANFREGAADPEPYPGVSSAVTASVPLAGAIYFGTPGEGTAPFLMFHGDRDAVVPYDMAVSTCQKQLDAGNVCEFHTYDTTHLLSPWYSEIRDLSAAHLYALATCGLDQLDVAADDPWCVEVEWLLTNEVARGWPDGTFRPDQLVTRQAAIAFLWHHAGQPDTAAPQSFPDVPDHHPFVTAIAWGADQGLVNGWPDGTLRPADPLTRQAMLALLWRRAGSPESSFAHDFTDVSPHHPFREAIAWAAEHGVVDGPTTGELAPRDPISRSEAAELVFRARTLLPAVS
jgi:predicted esterase